MHVTHLDDHALALCLAPAFESYPASKRLRKEVPPQAAALRGTSPLAASSIPPCTTRRGETEINAVGHLSSDS